jgi:integrase
LLERFRVNLGLSAGREACARFWKEAVLAKPREPREPREPWQVAQWAMAVLDNIDARNALMARIQYGGGLRLKELVSLRVKDVDENRGIITVRETKGDIGAGNSYPHA